MANKWGISSEVEQIVRLRDKVCSYCGKEFDSSPKNRVSLEHIYNDIRYNQTNNIVLCCFSCNASKGNKDITDWFDSDYCKTNKISAFTVSETVKEYLKKPINHTIESEINFFKEMIIGRKYSDLEIVSIVTLFSRKHYKHIEKDPFFAKVIFPIISWLGANLSFDQQIDITITREKVMLVNASGSTIKSPLIEEINSNYLNAL